MKWWGWLALAAGGGVAMALASTDSVEEKAFALALPKAGRPFAAAILRAAQKHGLNPFTLAGLIERESGFGTYLTPKGPGGRGDPQKNDKGEIVGWHGHGLTQIDDRTWGAWLAAADWRSPEVNIDKGASILSAELKRFGGDYSKALAAYNAGPTRVSKAVAAGNHPDTVTTGKDYGTNVLARAERIARAAKASA